MAGNSTVDLLSSSNTVDDSANHPTKKQNMSAVLKRLHTCDSQQLRSLCSSFGISTLRSQDILIVMIQDHLRQHPSLLSPNGTIPLQLLLSHSGSQSKPLTVDSLTQLSRDQLWTFSDICGIPYVLTKAEYAGMIKNQLLDSVSPLVGEGGMVNLQFTPKPSKKETSDISNMPIHINRLEALSWVQLVTFCKMFGVSDDKLKSQLVEEIRLYLTSNPYAVTEDGVLIPGNGKSLSSNSSKKTLSKPVYINSGFKLADHQLTVNYRSRIFSAVVMGKAYYGLELVGGNKSNLAPLQTTINKGIRLFTGARLSTAIGPLLVETGIGSLLTRSLVSRVRLLERSVTKRTPINAICSGTDNDVFTLNVQGAVGKIPALVLVSSDQTAIQKQILADTTSQTKDSQATALVCIDGDSTNMWRLYIAPKCEQVIGHRSQSGLVPAIQKSRLRLLGRALDPKCGECIYLAPRWSLKWRSRSGPVVGWMGTVEHESMGTRHDNQVAGSNGLADFLAGGVPAVSIHIVEIPPGSPCGSWLN
ncbi:hypothetical protein BASA50_008650 [Batrachochytrium salamandrivorans]|uniref:Uncharacterized protein n=1 Tax=Batrachochytrium salamandrivorans TaxID=1357716 RepID=A0ABQ8F3F6_9FUNG|nr:hypothetical protein BASA50_008650 [Batrachochytrium salamandrivorans]